MAGTNYGLVEWFIEKLDFDFNDYVDDETKDKVKDQSSQEFFRQGMDIAISGAETTDKANTLRKLKRNTNMESNAIAEITRKRDFNRNLTEFFEAKLSEMVDRTDLPDDWKNDLKNNIPKYEDKKVFRKDIATRTREWEMAERVAREEEIRRERVEGLSRDAERRFEAGDLEELREIRDEARKHKKEFPEIFGEINERAFGLQRQIREIEREEKTRIMLEQQAEARRVRSEKLKEIEETGGGVSPDF